MARIRSVHPGLWTDEAFVSVSHAARLLFIGIWNEADDLGCFEWAPLKLKMRLLPADNVDTVHLLGELVSAKMLMNYSFAGRNLGAIRNFCAFQRPKKPKFVYPTTPEVRSFVASEARGSEPMDDDEGPSSPPVPHQSPTPAASRPNGPDPVPQKAEIHPQMKEEGGRREKEEEGEKEDLPFATLTRQNRKKRTEDEPARFAEFWSAYPRRVGRGHAVKAFAMALTKASADVIIAAVKTQKFDSRENWRPYPATWLNAERWRDESDTRDPVLVAAGYFDAIDGDPLADLQRPELLS